MRKNPSVSIVIPCRNSAASLPRLFESILRQSFKDLEVIVVDDASEHIDRDIFEGFRSRGLAVTLFASPTRLYTKNARMTGVRKAKGNIIAFADADDALWGDALGRNVALFERCNADVVQFRTVCTDTSGNFTGFFPWGDPIAPHLSGRGVFSAYVGNGTKGHTLWNKLYSRKLWLELTDIAEASRVLRYPEDAYLASLYMFHARKYIGSEEIGYAYAMMDKRKKESAERSVYHCILLRELLPYFATRGCPEEDLVLFAAHMTELICIYAGRLSLACCSQGGADLSPCRAAIEQFGIRELIKAVLVGARVNANRARKTALSLTTVGTC
jgi:Glycosyltransferases involved in cell wall biogenesis